MKLSRIGIAVFGAALLFSASAFAKDTNKGTLQLEDKVTVDGTPLNPGNYKVEWQGSGPDVTVNILKGNQTVATFPAKLTEQKAPASANAYGATDEPNGGKVLNSIYFGGKHYALTVQPESAAQHNQPENGNATK